MPVIHGPLTAPHGAVSPVRFALPRGMSFQLRRAGTATPQPIETHVLLDTGAEQTTVDQPVVTRLGLPSKKIGVTNAPGVGGYGPTLRYDVSLAVLHPSGRSADHLNVDNLEITDLPLRALGYDAVLGRDVLARCHLIYDGLSGAFTLSY